MSESESPRGNLTVARQGLRYLIVGFSSAGIELVAFSLMFYLFAIPVEFSSPLALVISTAFNFVLSSTWSFKGSTNMARSIVLYLLLFAFNLAFSSFAGTVLVSIGCPGVVAKLFTMACIVLWNFVLYRKIVFR